MTQVTPPAAQTVDAPAAAERLPRAFWVVWAAAAVSFVGDGIYVGALPLLVTQITLDPQAVSTVTVMSNLGWIVLGLISGALVDRWSKTAVMWRVDALRAALVAALGVLALTGHAGLGAVYGTGLMLGMLRPFFDNASSAVLPELVAKDQLERANSWTQSAQLVCALLVGPPVGAALFAWHSEIPLLLQAGSFAVASALVAALPASRSTRPRAAAAPGATAGPTAGSGLTASSARLGATIPALVSSVRSDLGEGLRYLAGHRLLRTLALLLGAVNAVSAAVLALLVLYTLQVLHLPEAAYGWLVSSYAVGGLVGTACVTLLRRHLGTYWSVISAAGAFVAGSVVLGLLPSLVGAAFGVAVMAAGSSVWNVVTVSMRQRVVPAELLGRVTAAYRMVGVGAVPVGAAAGGALASLLGVAHAYLVCGAFLAAALVASMRTLRTQIRILDRKA